MTPELGKSYRLRNGTVGLVDELLHDGTFYGMVTAPGTDLKVRVIWDKDGASTKRGEMWDLTDEMSQDDVVEFVPKTAPDNLSRIAVALERIAAVLEWRADQAANDDFGEDE